MHHHVARKGHGQVVAQALLAELASQLGSIATQQLLVGQAGEVVAGILYLEQELVALFAILAHQRGEHLHGGCLYLLEAVEVVNVADGVEYIVAFRHLYGRKVAGSFRNTRFCCHIRISYISKSSHKVTVFYQKFPANRKQNRIGNVIFHLSLNRFIFSIYRKQAPHHQSESTALPVRKYRFTTRKPVH